MDRLESSARWIIDKGLAVTPIIKGSKRPSLSSWAEAWVKHEEISVQALESGDGLGAVIKAPWLVIDIDNNGDTKHGLKTWEFFADLINMEAGRDLFYTAKTPSGGYHIWVKMSDDQMTRYGDIRNSTAGLRRTLREASYTDPVDIDIRGDGGFIIAPPTVRDGVSYEWLSNPSVDIPCAAPDSFFDALTCIPTVDRVSRRVDGEYRELDPTSPAAMLRSRWDWAEELQKAGWSDSGADSRGDTQYVRPGKEWYQGHSATLHGEGPLVVWSDAEELEPYHTAAVTSNPVTCLDPLGFYAAVNCGGDRSTAARILGQHYSSNLQSEDGMSIDLMDYVDWEPLKLDVGQTTQGLGILPRGTLCGIFGHKESGKSWFSLALQAQLIREGRKVLHVDFEFPSPGEYVHRMQLLGIPPRVLVESAVFVDGNQTNPLFHREEFEELLQAHSPELVVVDSLTEIVLASGGDHIKGDRLWTVLNRFKVWAQEYHCAFMPIDHQARGEGGSDQGAGNRLKGSVPNGVYLRTEVVEMPTKTTTGIIDIYAVKDKTGHYAERDKTALRFIMRPSASGEIDWEITPPIEGI